MYLKFAISPRRYRINHRRQELYEALNSFSQLYVRLLLYTIFLTKQQILIHGEFYSLYKTPFDLHHKIFWIIIPPARKTTLCLTPHLTLSSTIYFRFNDLKI